jgi:hypothetical protein
MRGLATFGTLLSPDRSVSCSNFHRHRPRALRAGQLLLRGILCEGIHGLGAEAALLEKSLEDSLALDTVDRTG